MSELEAIQLTNPTAEDFSHKFSGEDYTVKSGETKHLGKFAAYHLAWHLSAKMIQRELEELKEKALKKKEKFPETLEGQRLTYDNPERRKKLYLILKDKLAVQEVIKAYVHKDGFIGQMSEYEEFVNSLAQGATA